MQSYQNETKLSPTSQAEAGKSGDTKMKTTKLNNGTHVLAKEDGNAYQFANKTQAANKAAAVGGTAYQAPMSRVFYVKAS